MTGSRLVLFACHLVGNALLLLLAYYWLGVSESNAGHLLWSIFLALILIGGTAWLHGFALAQFHGLCLRRSALSSLRNLLPLVLLTLVAIAVYGALTWLANSDEHAAYAIGSYSTMKLRRPVAPSGVHRIIQGLFWITHWVVVPAVLLPLAGAVSVVGWRGWNRHSLRLSRRFLYWIEVGVLLVLAIWVPLRLFFWVPLIGSFAGQMTSFVLRAGIGYLLFVSGLLLLEFLTASGNPREIQPSTATRP